MTEYGRGPGPEPWYPDNDPLNGQGQQGAWDQYGQQAQYGQDQFGQTQYQQDQYQQDQYGQGQYQGEQYGADQYGQGQYQGEQYGADQYGQGQYQGEQYGQQYQDTGQGYPQGYDQQQYPQQGGWGQGDQYGGQYAGGGDPSFGGQQQADGYRPDGYGTDGYRPDGYGTDAFGPGGDHQDPFSQGYQTGAPHQAAQHPEPQYASRAEPVPGGVARATRRGAGPGLAPDPVTDPDPADPGPDPETGWDPGPDQGEKDFFTRGDDDDDAWSDEDEGRRGGKKAKKRSGPACLIVAVVIIGAIGGAGYWGYGFYQDRFGPPPDYAGEGTGEVEVEIPEGASLSDMGNILKREGVVASHDAFVEAAGTDGQQIQAGIYTLRKEMSAEAAVAMMLEGVGDNALTIPEGTRATAVYELIDERLGLDEGTTEDVAESADLGLPDWAEGDIEGFLWPARYDVGEETTPEDLLTSMVDRAEAEFEEIDLEGHAAELDRTPHEILVIASLVQAEAQADDEFGKVSRVIYNRLDIDMKLQFDSTINYAMGRSTLNTSIEDTQYDSPYNTYNEYGLPPGPIDNPGHQALEAALNPTEGPWIYFVTVSPGDTRFTDDPAEHDRNVEDFNEANGE
ncbi:endolytic transglycosylase MltG [Streptomyces sp. RFCAC02]|uniref:endolytic transglycosylase MltG n=1 Tax=Streptomyces sp. RFCAC02 TaxID=2499143 RepID=UPI00101F4CDD|nr:endolytic transglycosylase MltG [Streptomyces sp. RFCAC02]